MDTSSIPPRLLVIKVEIFTMMAPSSGWYSPNISIPWFSRTNPIGEAIRLDLFICVIRQQIWVKLCFKARFQIPVSHLLVICVVEKQISPYRFYPCKNWTSLDLATRFGGRCGTSTCYICPPGLLASPRTSWRMICGFRIKNIWRIFLPNLLQIFHKLRALHAFFRNIISSLVPLENKLK